jgi:hypothetical protein
MWVIREASKLFVPVAFGLFLFTRRVADSISNFLQLGSSQTLRRYLPMYDDASVQYRHIVVNIAIFVVVATIFCMVLLVGLPLWTRILNPTNPSDLSLTFWLGIFSATSVLGFFATSILLAFRNIKIANVIDIMNTSGWLLLGLWWQGKNITVISLFIIHSVGVFTLSCAVVAIILIRLHMRQPYSIPWRSYMSCLKESIGYGLPRTLTPFLETSLFVIGPWLIREDVKESGYLIISFTFLRIGRMFVQPAAMIIGITIARLVGQDEMHSLKKGITYLFGTVMYAGFFLFAVMFPWIRLVLDLWLGNTVLAQNVLFYTMIIFFAMPPLAISQALKEPIEMIWKKPMYLLNLLISILIIVIWFYCTRTILGDSKSILFAYVLVYWVNCLISIYWLRNYLEPVRYYGIYALSAIVFLVAALNWLLSRWVPSYSLMAGISIAVGSAFLSLVFITCFLYYAKSISLISDVKQYLFAAVRTTESS